MRQAEEWFVNHEDGLREDAVCLIKQIQLDAIKEGMRRAANVVQERRDCYAKVDSGWHYSDQDRKAIITAAEQLTEKDL